jgi:[CysO sulfur-carrier protein]-S-L-cysteine hydrolase
MHIPRTMVDEIIAHARDDFPNECCGVIAAQDGAFVKVFRARNAEASPVRYEIDHNDQYRIWHEIDDQGWTLEAIYHSHTRSEAYPSQTDINLAFRWPDAIYLIVSLENTEQPVLRGFRIVDERVEEVDLQVS